MVRHGGLVLVSLLFTACASPLNVYNKPSNLLFQKKDGNSNQDIHVYRDSKLCLNDDKNRQVCPIDFYIDDFKAGTFYINNKANYYLKPDAYVLKVKSCKTECATYVFKLDLSKQLKVRDFKISMDENDKPFITQISTQGVS
ncbi:hypothetical protein KTH71_13860 [Acinetobacter sp. WU_MDCI_Axc73]|nr:hypothetical protein [Acinetobacter sp. WU_MDCI_Axc73]